LGVAFGAAFESSPKGEKGDKPETAE
jgi:hypothetical protein